MPNELNQARQHHRHALRALREGCYEALSTTTRQLLIQRLKTGLAELNRTLDADVSPSTAPIENGEVEIDCLEAGLR